MNITFGKGVSSLVTRTMTLPECSQALFPVRGVRAWERA